MQEPQLPGTRRLLACAPWFGGPLRAACGVAQTCRQSARAALCHRCYTLTRGVPGTPVHPPWCRPRPKPPRPPPHHPPHPPPSQDKLGLTHLVGTPLLRAYMHGFFIDNRLYGKARAIADPFAYDAYRAKRVAAKLEEERRSRISLVKKLPKARGSGPAPLCLVSMHGEPTGCSDVAGGRAGGGGAPAGGPAPACQRLGQQDMLLAPAVNNRACGGTPGALNWQPPPCPLCCAPQVNAQAAARILAEQAGVDLGEGGKKRKGGAGAAGGPTLLEDDRFKAMFEDPEFAIDERSAEWKLLHPNTGGWRGRGRGEPDPGGCARKGGRQVRGLSFLRAAGLASSQEVRQGKSQQARGSPGTLHG